jgi:hypothetical protein
LSSRFLRADITSVVTAFASSEKIKRIEYKVYCGIMELFALRGISVYFCGKTNLNNPRATDDVLIPT